MPPWRLKWRPKTWQNNLNSMPPTPLSATTVILDLVQSYPKQLGTKTKETDFLEKQMKWSCQKFLGGHAWNLVFLICFYKPWASCPSKIAIKLNLWQNGTLHYRSSLPGLVWPAWENTKSWTLYCSFMCLGTRRWEGVGYAKMVKVSLVTCVSGGQKTQFKDLLKDQENNN